MPFTREQVERILIKRVGRWFGAASLDAETDDGTNADLNDPLGYALRRLGHTVANITNVADSDLTAVGDDEIDQLLDVAELRALENVLGNLDQIEITVGPISKRYSDLRDSVEKRIKDKRADIEATYGTNMPDATFDNAPFYNVTGDIWGDS